VPSIPRLPNSRGMHSAKIVILNINGLPAPTRVGMLLEFIRRHALDFVFLQEVTDLAILNITGYSTYLNIGTNMRGTAILARDEFPHTNVTSVMTGRAIAADHNGIRLVNVYATADMDRRAQGSISLIPSCRHFVCGLSIFIHWCGLQLCSTDTRRPFTTFCALSEIVPGLGLADARSQDHQRPAYTHYSPSGVTRIDHFYMTQGLLGRKTGIEILPYCFHRS
jgi:exonuclease III